MTYSEDAASTQRAPIRAGSSRDTAINLDPVVHVKAEPVRESTPDITPDTPAETVVVIDTANVSGAPVQDPVQPVSALAQAPPALPTPVTRAASEPLVPLPTTAMTAPFPVVSPAAPIATSLPPASIATYVQAAPTMSAAVDAAQPS